MLIDLKKYHIVLDNTYLITCYTVTDTFSPQSYQYNWLLNIFFWGGGENVHEKKNISWFNKRCTNYFETEGTMYEN